MTLTFIQGHNWMRNQKNFCVHYLRNFTFHLDEIQYVVTTCCFVEAYANLFAQGAFDEENCAFMKQI